MANCPPLYVEAPAITPYQYGLFSVASMPPEDADPHWQCGIEYQPLSCDRAFVTADDCETATPTPKEVAEGVGIVEAEPFTIFDGFNCHIVGFTEAEIMARARAALELGERRAVEREYWTGEHGTALHLADPSAVVLNAVPAPTAADALHIVGGLAALENYLADNYGGVGVIHAPRGVSAFLSRFHLASVVGSRIQTLVGTPVALGGGYVVNTGPDGTPAPPGTAWMYATGQVVVRRSAPWVNPNSVAAALNRTTNNVTLLAERTVIVSHECVLAAVLVTINC